MTQRSSVATSRRAKPTQAAIWSDQPTGDIETVLTSIMERLGITAPLPYERRLVALDHIAIPGRTQLRAIAGYARNIKIVGVLHDPAVTPITGSDTFMAIFGRHRLAGATEAGETDIWVRVYPSLDKRLISFLRLSEQRRRSTHWISELEAVIDVVDDRVALSELELALSLGVNRRTIREYLKMAHLPFFLRETVLGGTLPLGTVRMITRMPTAQIDALEARAVASEPIEGNIVKQMQQQRYTTALSQIPFAAVVTSPPDGPIPPAQEALVSEARQLIRQIELFQRIVADATPANTTRLQLGCRVLAQELHMIAQSAPATLGGAA